MVRPTETTLPESTHEQMDAYREFARQAGLGLAGLPRGDMQEGNLTLLLSLSTWLRISGTGAAAACSSLLGVRRALLEVSGLDKASEPVPLIPLDPRSALIGLAIYMHGLIWRSASRALTSPPIIVEEALDSLT
jgi:hypothetical protein